MTQWCTSRSIAAAVVIGSLKIPSHFENGRLLVSSTLQRSYRSDSRVNSTSISSRLCWTYPISSMNKPSRRASFLISFLRRIDSDLAVLGSQLQDLQVFLAALIPAKPLLKQVEGHTEPAGGEQLIAVPVVLEGARLAH